MKTDVQISSEAKMQPIKALALKMGIKEEDVELYGDFKAKISLDIFNEKSADRKYSLSALLNYSSFVSSESL